MPESRSIVQRWSSGADLRLQLVFVRERAAHDVLDQRPIGRARRIGPPVDGGHLRLVRVLVRGLVAACEHADAVARLHERFVKRRFADVDRVQDLKRDAMFATFFGHASSAHS